MPNTAVVSTYLVTHILEVSACITCISSVPGASACEVDFKYTHTVQVLRVYQL